MKADFNAVINTPQPVIVDFYTELCTPCETQVTILHEIVQYLGNRIKVINIDIDKNRNFANKLGVSQLPTLMLFRNGELKWRQTGVVPKAGLIDVIFEAIR